MVYKGHLSEDGGNIVTATVAIKTLKGYLTAGSLVVYRIAGNFGEVFNLVIWRILKKIAKLKTCQYYLNNVLL